MIAQNFGLQVSKIYVDANIQAFVQRRFVIIWMIMFYSFTYKTFDGGHKTETANFNYFCKMKVLL